MVQGAAQASDAGDEAVSDETDRQLRAMHTHFVRGIERWLRKGDSWEAAAHWEIAETHLRGAIEYGEWRRVPVDEWVCEMGEDWMLMVRRRGDEPWQWAVWHIGGSDAPYASGIAETRGQAQALALAETGHLSPSAVGCSP
jgi:hypothetical protein